MREEKKGEKVISFDKAKQKFCSKVGEREINALFMGLLKIVKKSAMESAEIELKKECREAEENFRNCLIDLNKAESLLKKLQTENNALKQKLECQNAIVCSLLQKMNEQTNCV